MRGPLTPPLHAPLQSGFFNQDRLGTTSQPYGHHQQLSPMVEHSPAQREVHSPPGSLRCPTCGGMKNPAGQPKEKIVQWLRKGSTAKKVCSTLLNSRMPPSDLLYAWRQIAVENRNAQKEQALKREKITTKTYAKKVAVARYCGEVRLLIRQAFIMWLEDVTMGPQAFEISRLREENTVMLKQLSTLKKQTANLEAAKRESMNRTMAMFGGSSSEMLRMSSFTAWKDAIRMLKIQTVDLERERLELDRDRFQKNLATSKARAMDALRGTGKKALLQPLIASWRTFVAIGKIEGHHEKELEKHKADKKKAARDTFAKLFGHQEEVLKQTVVSAWLETLQGRKQGELMERLRDEIQLAQDTKEKAARKMVSQLMGSQQELLVMNAFVSWRDLVAAIQQQYQTLQMKDELYRMKLKQQQTTRYLISTMFGSQDNMVTKNTFNIWREETNAEKSARKEAKLDADIKRMKEQKDASVRKAMASMLGTSLSSAFSAWLGEKNCAKLQRQLNRMKEKEKAVLNETMRKLESSQLRALLRQMFVVWFGELQRAREMKLFSDQLEESKSKALKEKHRMVESQLRSLKVIAGEQSSMVVQTVFTSWKEKLLFLRQERELERERSRVEEMRMESVKKAAAMLTDSLSGMLVRNVFQAWKEGVMDARKFREMQQLRDQVAQMRSAKHQSSKRVVAMMNSNGASGLMQNAFKVWKDDVNLTKQEQAMKDMAEQMLKAQMQQSDSAMRNVAKLLAGQGELLMQNILSEWKSEAHKNRKTHEMERMQSEVDSLRVQMECTASNYQRSLTAKLFGMKHSDAARTAMIHWRDAVKASRTEQQVANLQNNLKNQQRSHWRKTAMTMFNSQTSHLKQTAWAAWRDAVSLARQEASIDHLMDTIQRMKRDKLDSAYRLTSRMIIAQNTDLQKSMCNAWWDAILLIKQEHDLEKRKREADVMKEKMENSQRKMLSLLFGSQSNLKEINCFQGWKDCFIMEKRQREINHLKNEIVTKRLDAVAKATGFAINEAQDVVVMRIFKSWKEKAMQEMRKAQDEHAREKMERLQAQLLSERRFKIKMVAVTMSGEQENLMRQVVGGWREVVRETLFQKEVEDRKVASRKQIIMLMSGQPTAILHNAIADWRHAISVISGGKKIESLQEQLERIKKQKMQSAKKALARMFTSRNDKLLAYMFKVWQKLTAAEKAKRQKSTSLLRAMTMQMSSKHHFLAVSTFKEWTEILQRKHEEREKAMLRLQIDAAKHESIRRAMATLLNPKSSNVDLLKDTLRAWRDFLLIVSRWRLEEMEKLRKERIDREQKEAQQRSLSMMLGSHNTVAQRNVFLAWKEEQGRARQTKKMQAINHLVDHTKERAILRSYWLLWQHMISNILRWTMINIQNLLEQEVDVLRMKYENIKENATKQSENLQEKLRELLGVHEQQLKSVTEQRDASTGRARALYNQRLALEVTKLEAGYAEKYARISARDKEITDEAQKREKEIVDEALRGETIALRKAMEAQESEQALRQNLEAQLAFCQAELTQESAHKQALLTEMAQYQAELAQESAHKQALLAETAEYRDQHERDLGKAKERYEHDLGQAKQRLNAEDEAALAGIHARAKQRSATRSAPLPRMFAKSKSQPQ